MHGTVAAGNPHTAEAAAAVLRDGGNAADAAVAAAFASFVAEPLLASAGGAGMMTLALPDTAPTTIDFFSTVPGLDLADRAPEPEFEAVTVDFGSATQVFHVGRGAAAVPLALDGLVQTALRFGSRPLGDLVAPAVRMAREGVPLTPEMAHVYGLLWPILSRDRDTMRVVARGDRPPTAGTTLVNGELSELLSETARAEAVPGAFRRGVLSAFGPERGGLLTERDLEAAAVDVCEPLPIDLGEWKAFTSPRVGGQLVALIAERLASDDPAPDEAGEVLRMARASRHAHHERAALTAPGSTTHISVVDAEGGAAAVTLTNGEGSGHLIPGTGSQMNNFLGEEDLNPHGFHLHPPGIRLHTMIAPTVALHRGEPVLALGSGGSNRIRSSVGQVLYRVARLAQPLAGAVEAARVHAEEDDVWFERQGLADPDAVVAALGKEFARVSAFPGRDFFFGGVHGVLRADDGRFTAVGDTRRGGAAVEV